MEGTQEGQTSYLSGDVPVECVRLMPASLTAARGPGTVSTGVQRQTVVQVETLGAQQSQEGSQPHSPSQDQIQFTCPLCLREKAYQGTAASVAAHQREVHPGEGKRLLAKLGRPLQKTLRSNRYGVIIMTRLICTGTLTRSRSLMSPCCKAVKGVSRRHTGNLFFYCLLTEAVRTLSRAGTVRS